MSMISFTLPFLFIGILVAVWTFVFLLKKYFPAKVTHWMLLIYTSVLLLAAIVVQFGIKGTEAVGEENGVETGEAFLIHEEIHNTLEKGKMPDIDKKFISDEKTFELGASVLKVDSDWEEWSPYVVIEQSAESGQKIKVQIYSFISQEVDGFELMTVINPPKLKMSGNQLLISRPFSQKLDLSIVGEEFPISQFKNREWHKGSYSATEEYLILLQIPEHIQIDDGDGVYIKYLN